MKAAKLSLLILGLTGIALAQSVSSRQPFVREGSPLIAITHIVLIDGTGAPAKPDQTIIVRDGKIDTLGASAMLVPPSNARVIDRAYCDSRPCRLA